MYIVFVYFDFMQGAGGKYNGASGKYHEGLASISACLKQRGYRVSLYQITEKQTAEQYLDTFKTLYADADIVGFSSTSQAFPYVSEFANVLKKAFPDKLMICGGVHPSLMPEESLQSPGLDIVCRGEGEYSMLELCERLESGGDITSIEGLWVKHNNRVYSNPPRPPIRDLDALPFPDRDLFDYEHSVDKQMDRLVFSGSRGCPHDCTYCCNHALKKLCPGGTAYVRRKSPDRLIAEIQQAIAQYPPFTYIYFADDLLLLKKNWSAEFLEKYAASVRKPFACNCRFELINPALVDQLKKAGCWQLQLGLESGSSYIRQEVLNRHQSTEMILSAGKLIAEKQIPLLVFSMIGVPFETPAQALETVKMNALLRPTICHLTVFYPFPATELYALCQKNGLLTPRHLDSLFEGETTLQLPDFPPNKITFAYRNFQTFVSQYMTIFSFKQPWRTIFEKIVDFLWLHPRIYSVVNPAYRAAKKTFRSIRRKLSPKKK